LLDHRPGPVAADLSGRRLLDELREVQPDPNLVGAHDVRNPQILLGMGCRRRRQQSRRHKQSAKMLFHDVPAVPSPGRQSAILAGTARLTPRQGACDPPDPLGNSVRVTDLGLDGRNCEIGHQRPR
jgi:hypothetical protein